MSENDYVRWPRRTGGSGGGVTTLNGLSGAVVLAAGSGISLSTLANTITISATGGGTGTVTSVDATVPSFLSVSGVPITSSGTIAIGLATQAANTVFAGPTSGGAAQPSFRSLVAADIPALSYVSDVTASSPLFSSGGLTPNLTIQPANGSQDGYLSSTDWNTFNNKQAAGSYLTALTGDVTASGPGSAVATIANLAVTNAKIANATIDLTTKVTGILPIANGGTGQSSALAAFNALSPLTTAGDLLTYSAGNNVRLPVGVDGQILTVVSGAPAWVTSPSTGYTAFTLANNQSSPANVTGFLVNGATNYGFSAEYSISRIYSDNFVAVTEDTSFYTNLGTAASSDVFTVFEQADTAILVGGAFVSFNGNTRNHLVRLNASGTEDTAFYTNLGGGFSSNVHTAYEQADTKILVGGDFVSFNGNTRNYLVRLNSDGTEDTTFYTNLGTAFNSSVYSIIEQADTKLLIGGDFTTFNGNGIGKIVRLNADGTEDTAFSTNLGSGFNNGDVYSIVIQSDNKILIGGSFASFNGNTRKSLIRLNSDGTEDASFYVNLGLSFNSQIHAIQLQPDGKMIIGGGFTTFNGGSYSYLIRLFQNGTIDAPFYTALGTSFDSDVLTLSLQPNGQILVGGFFTDLNGTTRNRLVCLNSDGTENSDFYTNLGTESDDQINSIFLQLNEDILLGGAFTSFDGNTRNKLIRLTQATGAHASQSIAQGVLRGIYNPVTPAWVVGAQNSVGTDTGIEFSMTSGGQLQYISTDIGGTLVTSQMRFILTGL